jgi:Flp pilus assembly protein TadG
MVPFFRTSREMQDKETRGQGDKENIEFSASPVSVSPCPLVSLSSRTSNGLNGGLSSPRRGARSIRRGAALVEFALVAPIFLTFVVGSIELGRAIVVQEALTNASREGARVGILDTATTSDVTAAVNSYLSGVSISGATTDVSPTDPGTYPVGTQVTVTVSIPYASVTWVPSPWFLKNATLAATTVMQRQSTQ